MKYMTFGFSFLLTIILFCAPARAAQIYYETFGDVGVGYSDGTNYYQADEGSYDGHPNTSALSNFANPALISGFSFSQAYGVNSIGAKVGTVVNTIGFGAFNPSEPPKENTTAYASAYAQATNRYYFAASGDNTVKNIMMDFVWSGHLTALMDGLTASGQEAGAQVSYRVYGSAVSEGLWNPDGTGWWWSFNAEDTFYLTGEEGSYAWDNEDGAGYSELNLGISDLEGMNVAVIDHGMFLGDAPSFLVTYGIEVSLEMDGLAFEEGGYLNLRSDFYDTLGITNFSDNISPDPLNAVPVPAAIWLLGSGLAGLFGLRRKFGK